MTRLMAPGRSAGGRQHFACDADVDDGEGVRAVSSLPWKSVGHVPSGDPCVVLASRLRLRRRGDVPRFFVDAMRVRRQVWRADGALGVALIATLWRGEFFTLSARRNDAAMAGMVESQPHVGVMSRYHDSTAESRFEIWNANDIPTWTEAHSRLAT